MKQTNTQTKSAKGEQRGRLMTSNIVFVKLNSLARGYKLTMTSGGAVCK
jgi:hypothetical protein